MNQPLRILHLEDNPNDAELTLDRLALDGIACESVRVQTRAEFLAALEQGEFDLILSDYSIPSFDGGSALILAREKRPDIPFIFLSGTIGEERAIEALKTGATDYVLKDRSARLGPAIRRALSDVEERAQRRRAEEQIHRLAYFDALTGLANRAMLHERLQLALAVAQHNQSQVSLLLMDLDRFKDINDTLGHQNGDCLLQQVAQRLREALPAASVIARLGGDEFAVLLPEGAEVAGQSARHLLNSLQQPFELAGLTLDVKGSIGIALAPEHAQDATTLIQRADVAMYLAKATESGCAFYTSQQDQYSPQRLALMGELRQGIAGGQLVLYYQPKSDLKTGRITGVEALVRWQHPREGLLLPMQFVPMAEQTGLIKPLTVWALREALCQERTWHKAGIDLTVAVNLSARNLLDPALPDQVSEWLNVAGVAPDRLSLEITESIIMTDPERSLTLLTRLRHMGVRLSVDDFGTGYSSLAYLKRLPVHELKIDKAFVMGLMLDRRDAAIVRSTVELGHNLGLAVVAEGVEDQQTCHGLAALGCDMAQGYFVGRPLPADALTQWLEHRTWTGPRGAGHHAHA
jgi:diguanylate cyclase (GGDEF)-like protein